MAAQVVFQEQTVKAIADAIRAKIGSSNSIAGKDFASLIENIEAGGDGSSNRNGTSGTYIVANTKIIGIAQSNAIHIDTGLSQVNYFAFVLDSINSSGSQNKMLCGVWVRQNDKYYGRRYHQSGSSYSSIYPNNNITGDNDFVDINGVMQICGVATTTKIVAGDHYEWFAL